MEENQDFKKDEKSEGDRSQGALWIALGCFLVLGAAGLILLYYNFQQRTMIGQLSSHESEMNSTITQLQGQLDSTAAKLNDISTAQAVANQAAKNGARPVAAGLSRAEANRLRQLQAGLDDQQKQLQATQDDVTKTRSDLEGNLSSTRDELNGSIAKTHDELVLLEKRGEHNYFEFDVTKSKQFQRTGPVSISLRRSDPKHASVDLVVLVNDREISKKKVNLYEPVWIYEAKDEQPVQVVVNSIDKNSAHGYISAPKYSPEDLAAGASPAPAALRPPNADSTNNTNDQ